MMRVLYPDQIDIAYGSSAPLRLYDHSADPNGYYDIVSNVAELASPGCRNAVKKTLTNVNDSIRNCTNENFADFAYEHLNVCPGSIPKYIDNSQLFAEEIMQIIESSFADANMIGNYPPSDHTWFAGLCHVFQDETNDSLGRVRDFWKHLEVQDTSVSCFRMDFQLSSGDYSRISGADWSGSGPGWDGRMWDFQCCVDLIPEMNFSEESMFPRRDWTYEWLTQHCVERFGVVGDPMGMVKKWHFGDLVALGASNILFVNGDKDMWKAGSWVEDLSESILAVNMPNGAHHSEVYALDDDTTDIKAAQNKIREILTKWLNEIKELQK
jgi:lysosomal Pro-X carboxypeptidase